jgi:hypothetical protein
MTRRITGKKRAIGERIEGKNIANLKFDKEITVLLVIDPYNDFIPRAAKYGIA